MFSSSLLALLAGRLFSNGQFCTPAQTAVKLSYGAFKGVVVGNVTQFLGIPFAQPPVGDLRFREPMDPIQFAGLRMADTFGAACPQVTYEPVFGLNFTGDYASISEDCLTINVMRPIHPCQNLPVAVYFHGGGFEIGDSTDTSMNAFVERSIALGKPFLLVIPNYRVNAFGFLAGKEVEAARIGNLGLRDQQFALEWVQEHIATFGGDPNHVVIVGLSAGSISVGMHLVTSYAQSFPLFHGAFMESGSTPSIPHITEGQTQYDQLVAATQCTNASDSLDCLRHVPFTVLMSAINQTPNIFSYSSLQNVWKPRVDGDILTRDPLITLSRGLYAKVPIIAGDCDDEGTLFSLTNMNVTTDEQFLEYMHSIYLPGASQDEISALGVLYPSDPALGSPFGTGSQNALTPEFKRLAAIQGDLIFQGPRRNLLSTASKTQDAWGYIYKRGKSVPIFGVRHGSDIREWYAGNTTDYVAVDHLIQFVNTLDPNPLAHEESNPIFWPKWNTLNHGALLSFDDPSGIEVVTDDFRDDAIAFLNNVSLRLARN